MGSFKGLKFLSAAMFLLGCAVAGWASDGAAPGCLFTLQSDEAFVDRLPKRLQDLIRHPRGARYRVVNQTHLQTLFETLDLSFRNGGKEQSLRFGDLRGSLYARLNPRTQELTLSVRYLQIEGYSIGQNAGSGREILGFILGVTEWAGRKVRSDEVRSIRFVGQDLHNARLADMLKSLDFKKARRSRDDCLKLTAIAGLGGGAVGFGIFLMTEEDLDAEALRKWMNDADSALVGTAVGLMSACYLFGPSPSLELRVR